MTRTVLLVEDDADIREALTCVIEERGYRVVTAENGLDALDKLRAIPRPCLAFIDLMMPVMDGWQLRGELLKRPELAGMPVVLLSGIADLQAEARSLDAIGYLKKPVDLNQVFRMLDANC
jgi:CheY-like chemotaxis protein